MDLPEFSVKDVVSAIGSEPDLWRGNCYGVSTLMVNSGICPEGSRTAYGLFLGKVHRESEFAPRALVGLVRHGWIQVDGEQPIIIDPTRWVFECEDPYIFVAPKIECANEYDEGANTLRRSMVRPPPKFRKDMKTASLRLSEPAWNLIGYLLGDKKPKERLTFERLCWLSSLPLDFYGSFAKEIFSAVVKSGHPEYIPIDNRRLILGRNA